VNPVRAKVLAATAGAGIGTALGTFLLWLAGVFIWHAPSTADAADAALAAVPAPVSALVLTVLSAGVSFLGGWLKHDTA
jgi:hypothetical protein